MVAVPLPPLFLRAHEYTTGVEERSVRITTEEIHALLNKGSTADDVLKLYVLSKSPDDILRAPVLQDWIAFMKLYNKNNRNDQTSLISTLTKHYDDDGVARMIMKALDKAETAAFAKRLQAEQIHQWLEQQKTPTEVFAALKLKDAGTDLFVRPEMVMWAKYVEYFDKANPGKKTQLLPTFGHYTEEPMVNMLIAATTTPSTEKIAVRIQVELTQLWLKRQKSPAEIFTLLKLGQADGTLLENPLFIAWMKYTDDFNEMYAKGRAPAMNTLMTHYSSEQLAKMVIEAEKSPKSASVAKQLQSELLENWLKSNKSPSSVFRVLKLNKLGAQAFESPVLGIWLKYVTFYKAANPAARVNVAMILKKYFSNDVLAKMLFDAEKNPSTTKIANDVLDTLTIGWVYERHPPSTVYHWLRVGNAADGDVAKKLYKQYEQLYKMKYAS
ncbi:unnamed protein product [Phytophthora fragariaefolia]|uniref:Unnamed protein product n=1 Tax=Phytophthora fragariaefolia TaxID=1490495 RepID=A0A9W7DCL9_9STRA|nr:unnamed protein product [Phytophthora fragariaefolia]